MIGTELCMLNTKCANSYESSMDRKVIEYGLGWQLYEVAQVAAEMFQKIDSDLPY